MNSEKQDIINFSKAELNEKFQDLKIPAFRAKQVWHWLYFQGVQSFSHMTTLSKSLREQLDEYFFISRPVISIAQESVDGTRKWLLDLSDKNQVETVHIPEADRGTLCVSSQVGCTLTCKFCHTGTQLFVRNLTSAEIVGQVLSARDEFNEWPTPENNRKISNIVMMGMGEPLYNYDEVAKALTLLMDQDGIAFSKRKITLSTSGVVPMIEKCGQELGVNLAISLHAVRDDLRNELVPLNKKYPIRELLDACKMYPGVHDMRKITFEYVMLKGINDTEQDAKELVRLLKDIPSKVNLIPFNPWPDTVYECSSAETIKKFGAVLGSAGFDSPIRTPRGQDILAACGQLRSESKRAIKHKTHL